MLRGEGRGEVIVWRGDCSVGDDDRGKEEYDGGVCGGIETGGDRGPPEAYCVPGERRDDEEGAEVLLLEGKPEKENSGDGAEEGGGGGDREVGGGEEEGPAAGESKGDAVGRCCGMRGCCCGFICCCI